MSITLKQIVVLLREACDPHPPVRLTKDSYSVRERGLRRITNPADLSGLELALQLAEKHDAKVTAVAVGPGRVDDHLRLALSMGAERAVRIWNSAFQGGDAVADARLLGRIMEVLQPELVITGSRLIDRGDDPGPALASANLGIPYVTMGLEAKVNDATLEVLRKSDRGGRQRVKAALPCTLLVEESSCEPRYPNQDALHKAIDMEIEQWSEAELGLPLSVFGASGAVLSKEKCSFPRSNPQRVVTPDANLPAFDRILALLSGGIKPREGKVQAASTQQAVGMLFNIFEEEGLVGEREN